MSRIMSVSEARNQLPVLVKEVAEKNEPIVITTRNEPKAIIMGYELFQRQQRLRVQTGHYLMADLVSEAQTLIEATQEGCHGSGESDLYLFLVQFSELIRRIWEAAEEISTPHALIACELMNATALYVAGEDQLHPDQLETIAHVLQLLTHKQLSMEDAAEADRILLAKGIDAMFTVHGDLVSLYEPSESGEPV